MYNKVNQTKFIPIIKEQGDAFDSYMPIFIKSRIGIDLSSATVFEDGYEQLLRNIYEKPKYSKPKLGHMPSFLEHGNISTYKTRNINSSLLNCIFKNPSQCVFYIKNFIEELKKALSEFKLEYSDLTDPKDELIYNKIHEMLPIKNDYISFLNMLCKSKQFNIDLIIKLFEDLYPFTEFQGNGSFTELQFDHYRFFILEIFLYTVVILINNEDYTNLNILLKSPYFVEKRYSSNNNPSRFNIFRFNVQALESRGRRLHLNKLSCTADLLIERSVIDGVDYKSRLIDADMFLYYLDFLESKSDYGNWFPALYVYKKDDERVDILRRLISKRHFEKIKVLFGVNTDAELKQIMKTFNGVEHNWARYSNAWSTVPILEWQIAPEDICSMA